MKKIIFLLICAVTLFTGCPRYESVRQLSAEQLRVQKSFDDTLANYFSVMEQYAESQALVSKMYLQELADAEAGKTKQRAELRIAALAAGDVNGLINERLNLEREITRIQNQNDSDYKQIDDLVVKLKDKHKEILAAHNDILAAQQQLDRYVQLKKFDEIIVSGLLGTIQLNETKLTRRMDEAADILNLLKNKAPK